MSVNISYLPEKGTAKYEELTRDYPTASRERLLEWTVEFRYKNLENFRAAMQKRMGLKRQRPRGDIVEQELEIKIEHIPYPKIELKPFKPAKSSREEEDMTLCLADLHLAKVTENYNLAIAGDRMDKLLESVMTIINLHRPIRKVHIFGMGDFVQGENLYQGSKVGEVECCAGDQIEEHAIPMLTRFMSSLAQGVAEIDFYGVRGNHGRYAREAPDKTNWDILLYRNLERALANQPTIHINPPKQFYFLINIRGFRFFLIHGEQVFATAGIPLFALRRKMQEWYAYVGGFNYGYVAHFHTGAYDHVNSVADYTICPPLVTGDSWALEKIGRASRPQQLCFGIHDKYGRSWEYKLHTDDKFLPQKFDEPEGIVDLSI